MAMNRRRLILGALAVMAASPVMAQTVVDRVIEDLRRLGYTEFRVGSTLLGRRRVLADGPSGTREIILNPRTGEILRDFQQSRSGPGLLGSGDDGRGRGRGGDDADDDDDDGGSGGSGSSGGSNDDDDDGGDSGGGGGDDSDDDDGGSDSGDSGGGGGDDDDDDD